MKIWLLRCLSFFLPFSLLVTYLFVIHCWCNVELPGLHAYTQLSPSVQTEVRVGSLPEQIPVQLPCRFTQWVLARYGEGTRVEIDFLVLRVLFVYTAAVLGQWVISCANPQRLFGDLISNIFAVALGLDAQWRQWEKGRKRMIYPVFQRCSMWHVASADWAIETPFESLFELDVCKVCRFV